MKKKYIFILSLVVILGSLSFFITSSRKLELESSYIYSRMKIYQLTGKWEEEKIIPFSDNSAEMFFIKGFSFYTKGDRITAEKYFKEADLKKYKDPILPIYLKIYLNECEQERTGVGDLNRIQEILKLIQSYPKLANDTKFVWRIVSTALSEKESRSMVIKFLEKYRLEADGLTFETSLELGTGIAMLKMVNKNYAESIYEFYDVIDQAEKISDKDKKNHLQIIDREHISNMYFAFEDYEEAIKQYDMMIEQPIENPYQNAIIKYNAYINRSNCYIALKEYDQAQKAVLAILDILPYLSYDKAQGVKLSLYNNLALTDIYKGDLEEASFYLKKCDHLLKGNRAKNFLNMDIYVAITRSKLLICQGKNEEAIKTLDEATIENKKRELGLEPFLYTLLIQIYEQTDETEKCLEAYKKLNEAEKAINQQLKQDYLDFTKESYLLTKLREQEKIYYFKNKVLVLILILILQLIIIQIIRIKKLRRRNFTDQLTEIYNRKYLQEFLKKTFKKREMPISMGVIMVDIDYFKNYNDTYGHLAGDQVIKKVAAILKNNLRQGDILIRYGGEEFLILLKGVDVKSIEIVCQRVLKSLECENMIHEQSSVANYVTVSLGISCKTVSNSSMVMELVEEADEALYRAKENGRNQTAIYSTEGI